MPADIRPEWKKEKFDTVKAITLIKDKIKPRLPEGIQLGMET